MNTLLIASFLLVSALVLAHLVNKERTIKAEAEALFDSTLLSKGITIQTMSQNIVKVAYSGPVPQIQEVHRLFKATDGNFYLYMHVPNSAPVLQPISEERAARSM